MPLDLTKIAHATPDVLGDYAVIRVDCAKRQLNLTYNEKQLLRDSEYTELFDHLISGQDYWVNESQYRHKQFPISIGEI